MSRKKSQPKKDIVPDPKFNSTIIPKLINNLMYDGKRGIASKIVYDAIEKIKEKSKEEPINVCTDPAVAFDIFPASNHGELFLLVLVLPPHVYVVPVPGTFSM